MTMTGTLTRIQPPILEWEMEGVSLGEGVLVEGRRAEVIGIQHGKVRGVLFDDPRGLRLGARVEAVGPLRLRLSPSQKSGVLDFMGAPLDGWELASDVEDWQVHRAPPSWLTRPRVSEVWVTGTRSLDSLLTMGRGQRVLCMGARGTGMKTALAKVARESLVDTVVWASIGDDGAEIRALVEQDLLLERPGRSLVVAAGAEQSAAARWQAGQTALAVAEYFREQGEHVLLVMDCVGQWMQAFRELTAELGGKVEASGLGPLPLWLARLGPAARGSISAMLSLRLESDSWKENDLALALDARLEGRILFSRRMAQRTVYPSVDILESVSRSLTQLADRDHLRRAGSVRAWLARAEEHRDAIDSGQIQRGRDKDLDEAIDKQEPIGVFLRQMVFDPSSWDETMLDLQKLVAGDLFQPEPILKVWNCKAGDDVTAP